MLYRSVQFVFVMGLGVLTEISVDFLKCMARAARTGYLDPDLRDVPLLVGAIAFFIFILVLSVITPERIVSPKGKNGAEQKITLAGRVILIAGFIVAVFVSGAFYPSPCDESVHRGRASSAPLTSPNGLPGGPLQVSYDIDAHLLWESHANGGSKNEDQRYCGCPTESGD